MGLAIGYSVAMSIPFVGANLALLDLGRAVPRHPGVLVADVRRARAPASDRDRPLLGLHLFLVAARHHTQFASPKRSEHRVRGTPLFPGYAPRSLGLGFAVAAVLVLLGGLVQINPVWLWGPYHLAQATNGAQPDWYLGWLIGGLRLVPGFEWTVGHYTLVPNPFWGGAAFPLAVFAVLYAWPRSSGG